MLKYSYTWMKADFFKDFRDVGKYWYWSEVIKLVIRENNGIVLTIFSWSGKCQMIMTKGIVWKDKRIYLLQ